MQFYYHLTASHLDYQLGIHFIYLRFYNVYLQYICILLYHLATTTMMMEQQRRRQRRQRQRRRRRLEQQTTLNTDHHSLISKQVGNRQEGRQVYRQEGIQVGRYIGREEGRYIGREEGRQVNRQVKWHRENSVILSSRFIYLNSEKILCESWRRRFYHFLFFSIFCIRRTIFLKAQQVSVHRRFYFFTFGNLTVWFVL